MTVSEAIEKVKERKPNAYSDKLLVEWLNDCEAQVQRELMGVPAEGIKQYDEVEDLEQDLLLPRPYDAAYVTYIIAMIEFNQQEYNAYNNSIVMFNTQYDAAQKYYNSTFKHTMGLKIRNWLR